MEIIIRSVLILFAAFSVICGMPNQYDYSVSNNKIIFLENDIAQRDPSISAAFLVYNRVFSVAVSYLNYYLRSGVDNLGGDEKLIGGFAFSGKRFAAKNAVEYFSFSNIYSELLFKSSYAIHCSSKLSVGINGEYLKKRLLILEELEKKILNFSATLSGQSRSFFYSLELDGINVDISQRSVFSKKFYIDLQGNTFNGKAINQGVRVSLCPTEIKDSRFFWAIKVTMLDRIFLNLNMSTNPLFFGLGIDFKIHKSNLFVGASTHPVLGTSILVGMDHLIMRR